MKSYTVDYTRDETGWWIASVRRVKGCHTQGRTIEEARRRIREALSLFVDQASRVILVDRVHLPGNAARMLREYRTARTRATRQRERLGRIARKAARTLTDGRLRLSTRDTAELLGLSHQRVHQLMSP